jgi:hypothetical protein
MNASFGWVMAVAAVVVGWFSYGWQGVVMAVTVTVFWLLLQFSRAMRLMRQAGQAPVGSVRSAVMLHARLRTALTMMQVVGMTKSLGRKVEGAAGDDSWQWFDEGGVGVTLHFTRGRLARWTLDRPPSDEAPADVAPGPSAG